MDRATIEPAIRIVLSEIYSKLNEAARIEGRGSLRVGGERRRRRNRFDGIEQLIYEAGRLQEATSPLNRLSRE
jgi:hypothetical protein